MCFLEIVLGGTLAVFSTMHVFHGSASLHLVKGTNSARSHHTNSTSNGGGSNAANVFSLQNST